MWKSEKNFGVLFSSRGFTMLESLVVFTIFTACAASIPLLYDSTYRVIEAGQAEKKIEWELFVIGLRNDLHSAENWRMEGEKLHYSIVGQENSLVTVSQYNDKIRRQVDQLGHEIMLQNVKSAAIAIEGGRVYVHVAFTNGEKEGAAISPVR